MSSNFWYLDRDHTQRGPVGEDEFVRLIQQGVITRETQMWTAGMSAWRMAGEVSNVASLFGPPLPTVGATAPPAGPATGPLIPVIPVWGLFWRLIVMFIGVQLIIPAPWAGPWFFKWLCERVSLPDGRPLTFSGKPGDIWYVFVIWGALSWVGQLKHGEYLVLGGLVSIPLSIIFSMMLLKWICAHTSTADGRLKLSFEGGYASYIGWNLLLVLSVFTIIGGAWVMKYMLRWICRNVRGTAEFAFTGTGLAILWRMLVYLLLTVLIIPIPWAVRWYTRWMLSQVSVVRTEA
jgi:hypothetical protein